MTRDNRAMLLVPIGSGAGHVLLVLGVLTWLGYPFKSFATTAIYQFSFLLVGLFLVAFVPVLLFTRGRLVVPLGMSIVGLSIALIAGLTPPYPEFATLGENVLVVGPSDMAAYANGWYIWLLAYLLGGIVEYAVRMTVDSIPNPQQFSSWHVQIDRRRSVLIGCLIGFAQTVVIITLGISHEGALLSGWLLGWGLLGMVLLGMIPTLFLLRYQMISPFVGLITIILVIGVGSLTMVGGTPASSYLLFWPVYFVLMLLLAIGEYALRWGHHTMTKYRRTA
ncbi:hypothetical protein [Haladaptatus sp. DYF46]|uniref:hypothetical protein n=1 Tax=Haladaptatus sp. DYF46 TaxID=2886041 RepID=UPI001E64951C|nr:hypothetical protein [Haladaptatus sp. DYF46]